MSPKHYNPFSGGSRGGQPPFPYFQTKLSPEGPEKNFWEATPPPPLPLTLSKGLDDRTPPPLLYLKVWIRHWGFQYSQSTSSIRASFCICILCFSQFSGISHCLHFDKSRCYQLRLQQSQYFSFLVTWPAKILNLNLSRVTMVTTPFPFFFNKTSSVQSPNLFTLRRMRHASR